MVCKEIEVIVAELQAPFVGKQLTQRTFRLSEELLLDYSEGLDLAPWKDRAPSTIASGPDNDYFNEIAFPYQKGHLWTRQRWACSGGLVQGKIYTVGGEIRDIYDRRDRSVVHYDVTFTNGQGQLYLTTGHHQSFLKEPLQGDEVSFRTPSAKPGARKFEVPQGERFGGLERTISLEMCGRYFHGNANYHTDAAASKALGFSRVVVGGRMTMAYAAHILEERYSSAWWDSGILDLKFTIQRGQGIRLSHTV
jgi:hypothetical protein